ncbi:MAG TPA: energy transducer TonB [Pyrinomonadaceae bacterium]|nr:energy transducer TonB [Pyrinomonadaceae bacterium]
MANLAEIIKPTMVAVLLALIMVQCDRNQHRPDATASTPSPGPSAENGECDFSKFSPMKARANHGSPLISLPRPQYPPEAKERGVEGQVAVRLLVNVRTGLVEKACVIEGEKVFAAAAMEAGMRVKFDPYSDYIQQKFAYAEEIVKYQFTKP